MTIRQMLPQTTIRQTLPLTSDVIAAIAERYSEPAWMRAARHAAWAFYESMSWPASNEEAWRRAHLERYPLDEMSLVFAPRPLDNLADLPPCWQYPLAPEAHVSGTLAHCNGSRAYGQMRASDAENGVVLEDLHHALHTHGDLIRAHWMQGATARPDFNRFTALNAALWHGGTFVYAPAGVRVARPLQSLVAHDADSGTSLHHTLIIAEAGSQVALIQDRVSQERRPEMSVEMVEIHAEPGAIVRYVSLQHWGAQRYAVSVQDATVGEKAKLLWITGAMGSRMSKEFLRSNLAAPGARAQIKGFTFAHGDQRIDQSTYQHHSAPDTRSDLLMRNALRDRARAIFYGMIRVETEAAGAQAYQANNNLILAGAALPGEARGMPRAHAIPGLEIIANEVQCSHGATVSRIDPEQLFYLESRGLPRPDAERLIVRGFMQPIVDYVPMAHIRQRLGDEIVQRYATDGRG
ncbi:MAG: Fe-S cluster assembly protein SufD [Anaerolineales bacterium]